MNRLISMVLLLVPLALSAQQKQLRGKAISDVLKAENVNITNTVSNAVAVTDSHGNFTIYAKVNDTLRFKSDMFRLLVVVLREKDFAEEVFAVKLVPAATMLDEVVVSGLTGNLAADSKNLKTMQVNTWFDPIEINKDVVVQTGIGGANWIAGFAGLFKKPKQPKRATEYIMADVPEQKLFSEVVRAAFPESFFTEKLGVPARQIRPFLAFCDEDAKQYLLMPKNEPELIEYLKGKSAQYLKQNPDAK